MSNQQQRYGAGTRSARPAWANWLIVGLVLTAFAVGALILGTPLAAAVLALAVVVCLIGAGVSALMRRRS